MTTTHDNRDVPAECKHCTVPVVVGDTCAFCGSYTPPATTWRDLTDQLTPNQIQELAHHEAKHPDEGKYLLVEAESYAAENRITATFANVPMPAGASVDPASVEWSEMGPGSGYTRLLHWASFETPKAIASIEALQESSGEFERGIMLSVDLVKGDLTAVEAREIAAMLIEAADELDRLS